MVGKSKEYVGEKYVVQNIKNTCQFPILSFQSVIHSFRYTEHLKKAMITYIKSTSPHINRTNSMYKI